MNATIKCPRGHGPMDRRELAGTPEQAWGGTWWDCPADPRDVVLVPSAVLLYHLRQVAPPCDTCHRERGDWPTDHLLYRESGSQCPLCMEADIADDMRHVRAEDL